MRESITTVACRPAKVDRVSVSVFGRTKICLDDQEIALSGMSAELLTILSLERYRPVSRHVLIERLWGDVSWDVGRRRLNTTIHRFRADLSCLGLDIGLVENTATGDIVLNQTCLRELDVERFARAADRAVRSAPLTPCELAELENAAGLYRPEICAKSEGSWIVGVRARLENEALAIWTRLANHHLDQGEYASALAQATAALGIDDLREDLHRLVIRCHLAMNDRASAIRHFENLKQLLADELDVSPMPETTRLIASAASDNGIEPELDVWALRTALEDSRSQLMTLLASVEDALRAIDGERG